ncbi:nucleotide exchange factor GrpE [Fusibacter bizertensis]|uniref:Protein GrpE n=1 Tax=Fusibacter bizertensis TaxID=1488331 RepID=A0ABT6NDA2_9FIRM|nr:nucleotide exchange factor GrpE [Fusibacter bizertensis]MDH8678398.1 nucleotide exchange factor GrpE [Fusibacter bizertensis]
MAKSNKKTKKADEDMSKKKAEESKVKVEAEISNDTADTEENSAKTSEVSVESLKSEIDQLNDKFLRLNAEYQNYRKRVEKEKNDIFKYGSEKLFVEMLPIMDNFERALSASEQENIESKVLDGIKMIKKSLDELFDRNGVKKIEAMGMPFDPIKHHAVMTVESEDENNDHVIEVFQDGYALNDKVIRPSMVKVSH